MIIKKFYLIFFFVFLFLFLECCSYLIIPNAKLSKLDAILRILDEDPNLFWIQRKHLDTEFQGVRVFTNSLGLRNKETNLTKDANTYRIICLGASPTFGWGVNFARTYPFLLEQRINECNFSKKIEVINAAQIGFTSFQGKIFLKEKLLKYAPDLVTVAYVLNDIDRYRFYRNSRQSDKELSAGNLIWIRINNRLKQSRFFSLLKSCAAFFIEKNDKKYSFMLKEQLNLSIARVSSDDYRKNLEEIIQICRANNFALIFIKMPVNLSFPLLNKTEESVLSSGQKLSEFYYNLACAYQNKKEYAKARFIFEKAKDYQVFDCQDDALAYQSIMAEVAVKYNIPLVDAVAIFQSEGRNKDLFNGRNDPIHPNVLGHSLIADALSVKIQQYSDNLLLQKETR